MSQTVEETQVTTDDVLNRVNDQIDTVHELIELAQGQQAQLGNAVHKTGDEIIAGEKTFTQSPLVPTPAATDTSQKTANMAALARVKQDLATTQTELAAVKDTADSALPKSGGEMTGNIILLDDAQLRVDSSSMEKGVTPTSSIIKSTVVRDKNGLMIGGQEIGQSSGGYDIARLFLIQNGNHYLGLYADHEGGAVYASCPHPRGLYNNDIPTMKSVMDYAPQKINATSYLHAGGANSSDTADLFSGRGESAEMPFATPTAAIAFAAKYCSGLNDVRIILHDDFTLTQNSLYINNSLPSIMLESDDNRRTLTIAPSSGQMKIVSGHLYFHNLNLSMGTSSVAVESNSGRAGLSLYQCAVTGSAMQFLARGGSTFVDVMGGVSFDGTASTYGMLIADRGGTIYMTGRPSGTVTGKGYSAASGGRIFKNGKTIPGDAGTCDASSIVV